MALYMDFSNTEGAIGFISDGEPVIPVGVSFDAMPISIKENEGELYQRFARENDVHFLFADRIPAVAFYAVPRVDIAATDSDGGYIASVGGSFDLSHSVPLIYISSKHECFLITEDSTRFLSMMPHWKKQLVPYNDVTLYSSKEAAKADIPITDVADSPEYQQLLKIMDNQRKKSRSM